MDLPIDTSVICPILVGRASELHRAAALTTRVAAQEPGPRLLLVEGEAGIGKSRLVAELTDHARRHGWRVVGSTCFEPDQSLPYGPIVELAAPLWSAATAAGDPTLAQIGAVLHSLLPDLVPAPTEAPRFALEPSLEQRRIFRSLALVCERLAAAQPLLLVIEDLHWSDAVTLDWLLYLARQAQSQPLLVALTFRGDEASPALGRFLAEVERLRLAAEIGLKRLGRDDVGTLLRATLGSQRPVGPAVVDELYRLTDGNPFFLEETLKALLIAGALDDPQALLGPSAPRTMPIPRSIQEAVRRRTASLSADARELVSLAAVIGRRFRFGLLEQAAGHDEATTVRQLKELMAAQLVVEAGADQFVFRHGLAREALYTTLLERERRSAHRRLAEVIAQHEPEAHAAELAYHFFEAGDWPQAYRYAQQAALAAQRLFAPHEVIRQATRALLAAQKLFATPLAPLYHTRGQAYETIGEFAAARADFEAALRTARAVGSRHDEWTALLDLGFLWSARDYGLAGDYLAAMLQQARELDDPRLLATSLNRVGNWQLNLDQPLRAQPYHHEALAIFEQLDDQAGLAETYDLLGITHHLSGDLARGSGYLRAAIERNQALDNRAGLVPSLGHLALRAEFDVEVLDRPLVGMAASAERAAQMARQIDWRSGQSFALLDLGSHLTLAGDYGGALRAARRSLEIAEEIDHYEHIAQARVVLGRLALALLDPAGATRELEPALAIARRSGSLLTLRVVACVLILAYAQRGDDVAAEALLTEALGPTFDPAAPLSVLGRQVRAAEAELRLTQGHPAAALDRVEQLIAGTANRGDMANPRLWLLKGQALAALGRDAEAEALFAAGLAAAERDGARPLAARLLLAQGHLWERQRRRDHADQTFERARALFAELASTLDAAEREQFQQRALALIPERAPLSPRQATKQAFDGLTAREREVAVLIAAGHSNRQIADALVLSERTVTTHIGNILGKLGLTSRTQVARWAIEKGLANAQ